MGNALPAEDIAAYAKAAGFTGTDLTIAVAVAYGESGGKPDNVGHNTDRHRSTDFGLWQINDYWNADVLKSGSWANPADNARMAYVVWKRQGWKAWYAYTNGSYLAHMPKALAATSRMSDAPSVTPVPVSSSANDAETGAGFGNQLLRLGVAILGAGLLLMALMAMSGQLDVAKQAALLYATKGRAAALA